MSGRLEVVGAWLLLLGIGPLALLAWFLCSIFRSPYLLLGDLFVVLLGMVLVAVHEHLSTRRWLDEAKHGYDAAHAQADAALVRFRETQGEDG